MALSCQGFSSIVLLWSGGGIAMGVRIWGKTPGAWTWRSRSDWRGPIVGPSASRKQEQKADAIQAGRVWMFLATAMRYRTLG